MENWIPLILSGIFAAFGTVIWGHVSKLIKKADFILDKGAKKVDYYSEKYMGDEASNKMWLQVKKVGLSLSHLSRQQQKIRKNKEKQASEKAERCMKREGIKSVPECSAPTALC